MTKKAESCRWLSVVGTVGAVRVVDKGQSAAPVELPAV